MSGNTPSGDKTKTRKSVVPNRRKFISVEPEMKDEASFLVLARIFLPSDAWYSKSNVPSGNCSEAVTKPPKMIMPSET